MLLIMLEKMPLEQILVNGLSFNREHIQHYTVEMYNDEL